MLSVLIPTFNYSVVSLVKSLKKQCDSCSIDYEIIVTDDGSNGAANIENSRINEFANCKFIASENNVGLSQNRNNLVAQSKFENLLFIDGDSVVILENYISSCLENLDNNDIVYGGRKHPEVAPKGSELRWKYGIEVEDKTAEKRAESLYKTLMFNNTLIKKRYFNSIKFDATIKKYGHEDTLFAFQAYLKKANVKHINNPIEHGDIDANEMFMAKTESGLKNLISLYKNQKIDADFVKILKLYSILNTTKLNKVVRVFYKLLKNKLIKNLKSNSPSLFYFNLYKIGYLCNIK